MTSKEFIISELEKAVEVFPHIQCMYRFDSFCHSHYVQILPVIAFNNSTKIEDLQIDLLDEFYERYCGEGLSFFTEGSYLKMTDPEYTAAGKFFRNQSILPWLQFADIAIDEFMPNILTEEVEINSDFSKAA